MVKSRRLAAVKIADGISHNEFDSIRGQFAVGFFKSYNFHI